VSIKTHDDTDLTEKQWQIIKKMVPPQKKDHNKSIGGGLSTPSFFWYEPVVSGGICRVIFLIGRPFTMSFGTGETPGFGKRFTMPYAVCLDSQTVKTTESSGDRGYDGEKKINGHKRHIIVDTLGLIMAIVIQRRIFRMMMVQNLFLRNLVIHSSV
jgi:transposase